MTFFTEPNQKTFRSMMGSREKSSFSVGKLWGGFPSSLCGVQIYSSADSYLLRKKGQKDDFLSCFFCDEQTQQQRAKGRL